LALVKDPFLKSVTGKLGSYVIRKMNGKTFISKRPDTYKPSQTRKSKNTRTSFGNASGFASFLKRQALLELVWSSAKLEGTTIFHKILKQNIPLVSPSNLTLKNIIVPPSAYKFINNLKIKKKSLDVYLADNLTEQSFTIAVAIYFSPSLHKDKNELTLQFVTKDFEPEELASGGEVTVQLSSACVKYFNLYEDCIVFAAAIFNSSNLKNLKWSRTFSKRFKLKSPGISSGNRMKG
jgi:hypothetical protein